MGSIDDLKWYPTLDLDPGGCMNDGLHPAYFLNGGFLFKTSQECCEDFYPWRVEECMSPPSVDPCTGQYPYFGMYDSNYLTKSEQGYYPDCKCLHLPLYDCELLNICLFMTVSL